MNGLLSRGLAAIAGDGSGADQALEPRFDRIAALLDRYAGEIETFNPRYALVKVKNREELVIKHILDSLAPLGHIIRIIGGDTPARIADAGSGAGFPGIPLAICLDRVEFTLIERMTRRADFLRNAAAALALSTVEVEETELERAEGGRFDIVVFRALSRLEPALIKRLFRLLARSPRGAGAIAAYKGRRDRAARELAAAGFDSPGGAAEIVPLNVPFLDEERCLALVWADSQHMAAKPRKMPPDCVNGRGRV